MGLTRNLGVTAIAVLRAASGADGSCESGVEGGPDDNLPTFAGLDRIRADDGSFVDAHLVGLLHRARAAHTAANIDSAAARSARSVSHRAFQLDDLARNLDRAARPIARGRV